MAKKEIKTDLWVARQLDDSKIKYDAQGSDVKEINDALQSASKRGTGNAGYPEYVAVVKDFVIVIEDKADLAKHQKLTDTGIISIDFRNDGYEVRAHVGLVEGDSAKDKRQHLLDVWNGRTKAASKFCVESTVKAEDEWLHSFFYFNDDIPAEMDFEKAIGDFLTFEFSMIMQNREYLFQQDGENNE